MRPGTGSRQDQPFIVRRPRHVSDLDRRDVHLPSRAALMIGDQHGGGVRLVRSPGSFLDGERRRRAVR